MNKLLLTAILSITLPLVASAEEVATTTSTSTAHVTATSTSSSTPEQMFTVCAQVAVTKRDNSISAARTAYNTSMQEALAARTEAVNNALELEDEDAAKDAKKEAADEYKARTKAAQDALILARKNAWSTYEGDTKICRDVKKNATEAAKKEEVLEKKVDLKSILEETRKIFIGKLFGGDDK